jgi:MscS family membrane protein
MRTIPVLLLAAGVLTAQTPAPVHDIKDPLGRINPQNSIIQFLEACHAHDYTKATHYLDLRKMAPADRAKDGPGLAKQLEDLLDNTTFDIATLSRDAEGDLSDNLAPTLEQLATIHVDGKALDLEMQRVELKAGLHVWLVSAASVELIPEAHKAVAETSFEKKLPQVLVTTELLDTPVWRWIALLGLGAAAWFAAGLLSWLLELALRRLAAAKKFHTPVRICLTLAGFRAALAFAPPGSLARLFVERATALIFFLALAWIAAVVVDLVADRWHSRLDPRVQSVSFSVLPLGRQVLKLALYLVAILSVVAAWGYNTSTILAGLGVGGLAVALAAQKTIENLFGGISVIGDRPVLVGDRCQFGDRTGDVMHIGLRSTRIRTLERTVISVPNSQFASMALENISGRDKIWFHPRLNLRRDTTAAQLSQVLASFDKILADHPKVENGKLPVRFAGVGPYSLDVEMNAYMTTSDEDESFALQQDLLLRMLQAVEAAGTSLAVPLQEHFDPSRGTPAAG